MCWHFHNRMSNISYPSDIKSFMLTATSFKKCFMFILLLILNCAYMLSILFLHDLFLKQYFKVCHKNKYVLRVENDIVSDELTGSYNAERKFFLQTCLVSFHVMAHPLQGSLQDHLYKESVLPFLEHSH